MSQDTNGEKAECFHFFSQDVTSLGLCQWREVSSCIQILILYFLLCLFSKLGKYLNALADLDIPLHQITSKSNLSWPYLTYLAPPTLTLPGPLSTDVHFLHFMPDDVAKKLPKFSKIDFALYMYYYFYLS